MEEGSKTGIIAAVVVVAALIGGGILFVTMRDDSSNDTTTSETQNTNQDGQMTEQASQNIVEVASANENFSTLVELVQTAGLVDTLSGEGPFTVFAPTNDAFAKLPAETVASLKANPEELRKVLTYHVVSGKVPAADAIKLNGKSANSVQGAPISIAVVDGKVVLNGNSTVTMTDIMASNGIVHVIDTVLIPPAS